MAPSPFANRLTKNFRHLRRWAERQDVTAYRVYDLDLPEYPFVVEWFDGRVQLVEQARRRAREKEGFDALRTEVLATVSDVLAVPAERIFTKTHLPMAWGKEQYERAGNTTGERFPVREQGLTFLVNLTDHLDTGLFLDHRTTRARVREEARGKRFLNLFCYTASFSVYAAAGGARTTTSVDLSNTYLDWARDNLAANGHSGPGHALVRSDVTRWVREAPKAGFDLIVLDPPSFSVSKKMASTFNVQRDQATLLRDVVALLAPGGVLYFSTNYRGFRLEADRVQAQFEELTPRSLPEDFHQRDIHRCWRVMARAS